VGVLGRSLRAALVGLPIPAVAAAQQPTWDLAVILTPRLPASVEQLSRVPGYLTLIVTYTGSTLQQYEIRSRLTGSSGTTGLAVSQSFSFAGTGTRVLGNATRALVDDANSQIPDAWQALAVRGGALPPDRYEFCAAVYVEDAPVTQVRCSTTVVELPAAPVLIMPVEGVAVETAQPLFNWMGAPPIEAGTAIRYYLRVAPMLPGRAPVDAIAAVPLLEVEVASPPYQYPLSALPLEDGMTYAWQVQARDADGQPFGRNGGRSTIGTFTFRDRAAVAAVGAVSLVPGVLEIPTLTGLDLRGGAGRWELAGTVPVRLTLAGRPPVDLLAQSRKLVVTAAGGDARAISGALDIAAVMEFDGATVRRLGFDAGGTLRAEGVMKVGGRAGLPAIGEVRLEPKGPVIVLAATPAKDGLVTRIGGDSAAVLVTRAAVELPSGAMTSDARVELFGSTVQCAPSSLRIDTESARAGVSCGPADTVLATGTVFRVEKVNGSLSAAGDQTTQAQFAIDGWLALPFREAGTRVTLGGTFSDAGLTGWRAGMPTGSAILPAGGGAVRLRRLRAPAVTWAPADGWQVRVPAVGDVTVAAVGFAVQQMDSLAITLPALEIPAAAFDGPALSGAREFAAGGVRVHAIAVTWPAARVPWTGGGDWAIRLVGEGGIAHASPCLQAWRMTGPNGRYADGRLDWPLDTAPVEGACGFRKPDGSVVAIDAIEAGLAGTMNGDSLVLTGHSSLVERVVTAAPPSDPAPPAAAALRAPERVRLPGGELQLRDAVGLDLVDTRRVDARTLELTPLPGRRPRVRWGTGALLDAETPGALRYDEISERMVGGVVRVALPAADPRRTTGLAPFASLLDSLVFDGRADGPRLRLVTQVVVFGRSMGDAVSLLADQDGRVRGAFDVAVAAADGRFDLVPSGDVWLGVSRAQGDVDIALEGGASTVSVSVDAAWHAGGSIRDSRLSLPAGGSGSIVVLPQASQPGAGPSFALGGAQLRLKALVPSTLSWTQPGGFQFSVRGDGTLELSLGASATFAVAAGAVELRRDGLHVARAHRTEATTPAAPTTPASLGGGFDLVARDVRLPDAFFPWPLTRSARHPDVPLDGLVRVASFPTAGITVSARWRADATVCGTAIPYGYARAVDHQQGGVRFAVRRLTLHLPSCEATAAGRDATTYLQAEADIVMPSGFTNAGTRHTLATPLLFDAALGRLLGNVEQFDPSAPFVLDPISLRAGVGVLEVQADRVFLSAPFTATLQAAPGAPAIPPASGPLTLDLRDGRIASGTLRIAGPFAWRLPSAAGLLAVQVPSATLSSSGLAFEGTGSIDGSAATLDFAPLVLGLPSLRPVSGSAEVHGVLPLALDAGVWRVGAGAVGFSLTDPLLSPDALGGGQAGDGLLRVAGIDEAGLTVRTAGGFAMALDPGSVRSGRAEFIRSVGGAEERLAWIDSAGLHLAQGATVAPDSVPLPSFGAAYVRTSQGLVTATPLPDGRVEVRGIAGAPLDVIFPSLGGVSVPMSGSLVVDASGAVAGGTLDADLALTPLALGAGGPSVRITRLRFARGAGGGTMTADLAMPSIPGLADLALPAGSMVLGDAGLNGLIANGSCVSAGGAISERSYAGGAFSVRLLGAEANLGTGAMCVALDVSGTFFTDAAGAAAHIPVDAQWNAAQGRWALTARAQGFADVPVGTAVFSPDAQNGVTVRAVDSGDFALVMRGAVRFPSLLGDGVAITLDSLRVGTSGVSVAGESRVAQSIALFDPIVTLRTSRVAAAWAGGVLALTVDGTLAMLGRPNVPLQGLSLGSDGSVSPGTLAFGQPLSLTGAGNAVRLTGATFAADAAGLGIDLQGSVALPAPFDLSNGFAVGVRRNGASWTATVPTLEIPLGEDLAIGDNRPTEIAFGGVATFDLLQLGLRLDLRNLAATRLTGSAALYLMNDVGRAIVFGDPADPAGDPGLEVDARGARWNATVPAGVGSIDLGLFRYALTGFAGVANEADFAFTFTGNATLDVPGVTGTLNITGMRIGRSGLAPGGLGAGPHSLSLLDGVVSLSVGSIVSGTDTDVQVQSAAGQGSAQVRTTTIHAAEFFRLTSASMSLGNGLMQGGVAEVLLYRTDGGEKALIIRNATLALAQIANVDASMIYQNGPDGFRLSAGGSARLAGGALGMAAAGFFSNRGGRIGAGLFVAATADIPILPPLITLTGIGGGIFINPTPVEVGLVMDGLNTLGFTPVGPESPGTRRNQGFIAFVYGGAGLIGSAGAYLVEGQALLQVASGFTRVDARGVMLGQTDRLQAGVSFTVEYGEGWAVTGAGELDVHYPGVDGDANIVVYVGKQRGRFDWSVDAAASLRMLAFNADATLFASSEAFFAELNIGAGFEYGPVEISGSVGVGAFWDRPSGRFGAFGRVSALVDLEVVGASASLTGAFVGGGGSLYLGFTGEASAWVGDWKVSGAVHASFDDGDFSAGLGRDRRLDEVLAEMRSLGQNARANAQGKAAEMRAAAAAPPWYVASEAALRDAGYALLTISDADRQRILQPVLDADGALPLGNGGRRLIRNGPVSASSSALLAFARDSVFFDPQRPNTRAADAVRAEFEAWNSAATTVAPTVLERLEVAVAAAPVAGAGSATLPPLPVQGKPRRGTRLSLGLDLAVYDATVQQVQAGGDTAASGSAAREAIAAARSALGSLDAALGGAGFGSTDGQAASVATAGELYNAARERLEQWQAARLAVGWKASDWAADRLARLSAIGMPSAGTDAQVAWVSALQRGTISYRQVGDAAVARRQALVQLVALGSALRQADAPPLQSAAAFRASLFAIDTVTAPGDFFTAASSSWSDIWLDLPSIGLENAAGAAVSEVARLLPSMAPERDSLRTRARPLTEAAAELYAARADLTSLTVALYDAALARNPSPADATAWSAQRAALLSDLRPPTLSAISVSSSLVDGVATADVTWSASHPGGLGASDAAASRVGESSTPLLVGGLRALTVFAAQEGGNDARRSYSATVRVRSRAGASVTRSASFVVDVPGDGPRNTPVSNGNVMTPDPGLPPTPTASVEYPLITPIPVVAPNAGVGNAALDAVRGMNFGGIPDCLQRDVNSCGGAGAPAAELRVYVTGDLSSFDLIVGGVASDDFSGLDVAIGTTAGGSQIRPFGQVPSVRQPDGSRRVLLRGLSLERDTDYWVRVRVRDALGRASSEAALDRPMRIDDRLPAAPSLVSKQGLATGAIVLRLSVPQHAPSGRRKIEYVVSSLREPGQAFSAMQAIPIGADTIVVPAEALVAGDTVWVHVRSVSYAEVRSIPRSIPVVRFVPPAPPPVPPRFAPRIGPPIQAPPVRPWRP
jgi:hypothetical protein